MKGYFISLAATRFVIQRRRGRERAESCVQMVSAGAGRMRGRLGHWGKKRLCSPEARLYLYISLVVITFCYYFFKKTFFGGTTVLFILIVSFLLVPSEAPCDGDLLWLLLCG